MLCQPGAYLLLQLRPPCQAHMTLMGSWATTTTETSPGIVPSSMGWTPVQMAEDSGCSLPISALPQDMVLPHEVGSPPATGALPQGPSTPTAIVPTVAQAPYNDPSLQLPAEEEAREQCHREFPGPRLYSRTHQACWRFGSTSHSKATGEATTDRLRSPMQYSACDEQSRSFGCCDTAHSAEPYAKTWVGS
jgi:hypothetical protein